MSRTLNRIPFRRRSQDEAPADLRQVRRQQACRDLIKSPHWNTLLDICDDFVASYESPAPVSAQMLCGYFVGSIISTGIGQLLKRIEQEAAMAPTPNEEK